MFASAASAVLRPALLAIALTVGAPLSLAGLGPAPAAAQDMSRVVNAVIRPGWRTTESTHMLALHITLADGWKTYWRAPGDGGFPPRFDWGSSENLSGMTIHWPRPVAFEQSGVRSIGYEGELVLPLEFSLRDPQAPALLAGNVEIGVCETICVPVRLALRAELGAQGRAADLVICAALADRPQTAASLGLTAISCVVEPISDGVRVTVHLTMPRVGDNEVVVLEAADKTIWVSGATAVRDGSTLSAQADMVADSGAPFALDRSGIRITVLGENRAADHRGC